MHCMRQRARDAIELSVLIDCIIGSIEINGILPALRHPELLLVDSCRTTSVGTPLTPPSLS